MFKDMNQAIEQAGESSISENTFDESFEVWRPKLEPDLRSLSSESNAVAHVRSEREILEEVLELLRAQNRALTNPVMSLHTSNFESAGRVLGEIDVNTEGSDISVEQLEEVKEALSEVLDKEGHHSAAGILRGAEWSADSSIITVLAEIKRTMLALVFNADCTRHLGRKLREQEVSKTLLIVPASWDKKYSSCVIVGELKT